MARDLVALKVDRETRRRLKILAVNRGVEMWDLVRLLVESEWQKVPPKDYNAVISNPPPDRESS